MYRPDFQNTGSPPVTGPPLPEALFTGRLPTHRAAGGKGGPPVGHAWALTTLPLTEVFCRLLLNACRKSCRLADVPLLPKALARF